jgi:hypothetical protein
MMASEKHQSLAKLLPTKPSGYTNQNINQITSVTTTKSLLRVWNSLPYSVTENLQSIVVLSSSHGLLIQQYLCVFKTALET